MKVFSNVLLTFLVVIFTTVTVEAQETSWKELNAKVTELSQQARYSEAAKVAEEALKVAEKTFGPDHPDLALPLFDLALCYQAQGKYAEAEPLYKRSLTMLEKAYGPNHRDVATVCENMAKCYKELGKEDKAKELEARARKIRSGQQKSQ